jgi:hypothetical protein
MIYAALSLPFLTIAPLSSGCGGGTGAHTVFVTAQNFGWQTAKQVPHFMHFS